MPHAGNVAIAGSFEEDGVSCSARIRLERIGGGSQLRDFGGDIAVLDQLGIAVGYLERGFVLLAPEPEVELVLGKRSVSGPAQRQHGWLNGGARYPQTPRDGSPVI